MDWKELLAVFGGLISLLTVLVKWLIKDWYSKSQQIEKLKSKYADSALDRLDSDVKSINRSMSSHQDEMNNLSSRLNHTDKKLDHLGSKLDESQEEITKIAKDLKSTIKESVKTELLEISKTATLIRDKKNGQS